MPMPVSFDGYVESQHKVSSTSLVSVARNRYSVPCEFVGQRVSARLYPEQIDIVQADAVIASHLRQANAGNILYDWQHYIPLLERKPGALRNGAPFADMPEAVNGDLKLIQISSRQRFKVDTRKMLTCAA